MRLSKFVFIFFRQISDHQSGSYLSAYNNITIMTFVLIFKNSQAFSYGAYSAIKNVFQFYFV